jgi:hypothetical protein
LSLPMIALGVRHALGSAEAPNVARNTRKVIQGFT